MPEAVESIPLPNDEVHAWWVPLDPPDAVQAALLATLSEDELARAGRFRFEDDRRRYVASRGALRRLLGAYLAENPASLRFSYTAEGKPGLVPPAPVRESDDRKLSFNVSHSHELAVVAVNRTLRIGVDVEQVRTVEDIDGLASRFFSEEERSALASLDATERTEAFFRCWTRKEAYVKATGVGVGAALDRFTVSLLPGARPQLLRTHDEPEEAGRWRMEDLPCEAGYIGAVIVEGHDWRLVWRPWEPEAAGI